MDEWQEGGPGSDPRYVDRDSSWLGRHKLQIAAIFLLLVIIATAVELFRPREPKLSLEIAAMTEPLPQPEAAENPAERQGGYVPEKSPSALDLSPETAPGPAAPVAPPATPKPPSPPERPSLPKPASPPPAAAPTGNTQASAGVAQASAANAPAPVGVAPAPAGPKPAPSSAGAAPGAVPAAAKPVQAIETKPAKADHSIAKNEGSPKAWWVINVTSTTEASDAERVFNKLRNSGHKVYSYQAEVEGRIWHRVRIGFFPNQAEAREVGEALAKQHNLPTPWVVRPGPDELKTHKN